MTRVAHSTVRAHIPGGPSRPGEPGWPNRPGEPGWPGLPGTPPAQAPVSPTRVWLDPHAEWKTRLYERLLEKRIVLASGPLDDEAAARLSAPLLTLDPERPGPIRPGTPTLRA